MQEAFYRDSPYVAYRQYHHHPAMLAQHAQPVLPPRPYPSEAAKKQKQQEDEAVAASFLLNLKHRSVTPEPTAAPTIMTPGGSRPFVSLPPPGPPLSYGKHFPPPPREQQRQQPYYNPQQPPAATPSSPASTLSNDEVIKLLDGSELVRPGDRDLVPDALFVAIGQMQKCHLTMPDRVGCYKSRPLGFVGLACKHCGGQPGFGRYYPNSVRSLAQTTTSQTILKHISRKCRFAPEEVRRTVNALQQPAAPSPGNEGRPRYGSRKIFFQRIWQRLHFPEKEGDESCDPVIADAVESETAIKKEPQETVRAIKKEPQETTTAVVPSLTHLAATTEDALSTTTPDIMDDDEDDATLLSEADSAVEHSVMPLLKQQKPQPRPKSVGATLKRRLPIKSLGSALKKKKHDMVVEA